MLEWLVMTLSKSNVVTKKKPRSASFLLTTTIADTTWRMFLPTLGGIWLGTWLDGYLKTKIIFTILLSIVGFIVGVALIIRQIKKVNKDE